MSSDEKWDVAAFASSGSGRIGDSDDGRGAGVRINRNLKSGKLDFVFMTEAEMIELAADLLSKRHRATKEQTP